MLVANWLIDKTDLIEIKHDLLREARTGDALLGLLGLDNDNKFYSLVPGGISTYLPYEKKDAVAGAMIRQFDVLLIGLVTVQVCKKVTALQMGDRIYRKKAEVPYDGVSTPRQWIFSTDYLGTQDVITL